MKVFGSFFKLHFREFLAVVLLVLALLAGYYYYELPMEYTVYLAVGIFIFFCILFFIGLSQFSKRSKALNSYDDSKELMENLPKPMTAVEKNYDAALRKVYEEKIYAETADERVYNLKEISLDKVVRSSVQKFANVFSEKKISFKYKSIIKKVTCDEVWLSFVLDEILKNAIEHTENGVIAIYMMNEDTLCVEDTGTGISEANQHFLFDKNDEIKGLYLCKLVCEKLGIKLSAISNPGEGTRFMLKFSK